MDRLEARGWKPAELVKRMEERGERIADGLVYRWLDGSRTPSILRAAMIEDILGGDIPVRSWLTRAGRAA
jgi:hypothetical protein